MGFAGMMLPLVGIALKGKNKYVTVISFLSMICCATSLFFQICYQKFLVDVEDWSAMMDIAPSMMGISFLLLLITVILNIVFIVVKSKE